MNCRSALMTVLDQVDYTAARPACRPNEAVGAVLPREVIALARQAIQEGKEAADYYVEAMKTIEELRAALDASVKLQSHYAELLNTYDAGERMTFKDGYEWVARLKVTGTLPKGN